MNMDSYANILNRWLGQRGLNPGKGAPLLGCAVCTAYEHAKGAGVPPATRLAHLAAVLGVPEPKLRRIVAADRARLRHARVASGASIETQSVAT